MLKQSIQLLFWVFKAIIVTVWIVRYALYSQFEYNGGYIYKNIPVQVKRESLKPFFFQTHERRNPICTTSNKPTGKTGKAGREKHKIGAIYTTLFQKEKRKIAWEITNKKHVW